MGNSSNAYVTKQPNTVNPSDWINKQEQIGLQYDAIKRQKEKDAQDRTDKLRKEFNTDFEGEFDLSSMGNDIVNKVFTPMAMQSLQDLRAAKDEGEEALNKYGINSKEYRAAKTKHDNIMKRPSLFKLSFEQTAKKLNDHNTLVASGKIHQLPENLEKLNSVTTEPIKYKQDAEGNYVIQQGENVYKLDEFAEKLDLGRNVEVVDEGGIISDITSTIGSKEYDERLGYETISRTNPWDDYTDPKSKEKKQGIKSILTKGYENALTDDVVESVLAGRGEFGYDEMSQNTKDELKAKILNEWLEVGRGQVEEKLGVKFDSSRYNQDARLADKNKEDSSGISFVGSTQYGNSKEATADTYTLNTPYVEKGTNKSARPSTYNEIKYDRQNGNVVVMGTKYVGSEDTAEFEAYKKAIEEQNDAYTAWNKNTESEDSPESKRLASEYEAKVQLAKVAKEKLPSKSSDWEDDIITNRAKVTQILAGPLGVSSYKEIQDKLNRRNADEEEVSKDTSKKTIEGF